MKNYMKLLAFAIFTAFICAITSCGDDEPDAYITNSQLYGTWESEDKTMSDSYLIFSKERKYTHIGVNHDQYTLRTDTIVSEGFFYLDRANEHLLGSYFGPTGYDFSGKWHTDYDPFEWLNDSHTRFSYREIAYSKTTKSIIVN